MEMNLLKTVAVRRGGTRSMNFMMCDIKLVELIHYMNANEIWQVRLF